MILFLQSQALELELVWEIEVLHASTLYGNPLYIEDGVTSVSGGFRSATGHLMMLDIFICVSVYWYLYFPCIYRPNFICACILLISFFGSEQIFILVYFRKGRWYEMISVHNGLCA